MMIILQLNRIAVSFGAVELFKDLSLHINEGERLALTGRNGCGKTSLLLCITGQIKPDDGEIIKKTDLTIGYMEQMSELIPETNVWEAVMSTFSAIQQIRQTLSDMEKQMAVLSGDNLQKVMDDYARVTALYENLDGYQCESLAKKILLGVGFKEDDFNKPLTNFSGGEKTRIHLARLLALSPELLLLDEPTNHLDMTSVEWLESYLINYQGTVAVVSHDRMFLDRIATRVAEIRGGKLISFTGNYSSFLEKRQALDMAAQNEFEQQQKKIKATEDFIRRYQAGVKAKQARGRQSQLDRLERIEEPDKVLTWSSNPMKLNRESGQDVLQIKSISKHYAGKAILDKIELLIRKGEKLALIGENGSGKTTLLKIIIGELTADQGSVIKGSQVDIGYFSQEHENLNLNGTVLDEIMDNFAMTLGEARFYLGSMLFRGEDVFKKIEDLSGGEQGRLALLKLILSGANFLVLDEPTNHLDIDSRQATAEMLKDYPGTILFVSHDRYFIDYIADHILALEAGKITRYWGNYSYYTEKKLAQGQLTSTEKKKVKQDNISPEQELRLLQKQQDKTRRQLIRAISTLEEEITLMEETKQDVENVLSAIETYQDERAKDILEQYQSVLQELEKSIQEWKRLNHKLLELESN